MAQLISIEINELISRQTTSKLQLIDARSSSEWQLDHLPDSINLPVLSDSERQEIGTIYKQISPFVARKKGAIYVARNIAYHLENSLMDLEKDWQAAVYCWRGGQRSGSMAIVLAQVGWQVLQLKGGYRSYRQWVLQQFQQDFSDYHFVVITGKTGSRKSQLLQLIADAGGQVIDLESLAMHRGSVLGLALDTTQPSQKLFESKLLQQLRQLNPSLPIFIEAESQKIGKIQLPLNFYRQMLNGQCLEIITNDEQRINSLLEDYSFYFTNPALLNERLLTLQRFHGREKIASWQKLIEQESWSSLVADLLVSHYDSRYHHAQNRHFGKNIRQINCPTLDTQYQSILAKDLINEFVQHG